MSSGDSERLLGQPRRRGLLLILPVVILRKLAAVNKIVLATAGTGAITGLGFSWIYERDEPKFMTPLVEKIAPLLPSKTTYKSK